jgi:hypothetical protein
MRVHAAETCTLQGDLLYKNLKKQGAAYPILHTELLPISRRRLITPTIEDDIVELLMRAPTHYFNEI